MRHNSQTQMIHPRWGQSSFGLLFPKLPLSSEHIEPKGNLPESLLLPQTQLIETYSLECSPITELFSNNYTLFILSFHFVVLKVKYELRSIYWFTTDRLSQTQLPPLYVLLFSNENYLHVLQLYEKLYLALLRRQYISEHKHCSFKSENGEGDTKSKNMNWI